MNIKLDENIPVSLIAILTRLGHDVDTVLLEGLKGKPDDCVWQAVQASGRFFITQDLDFSDARRFRPGTHPGVLVVRLRQPSTSALAERVEEVFGYGQPSDLQGCFVVLTDSKLRVRRPGSAPEASSTSR